MLYLSWSMILRHKTQYFGLAMTITLGALLLGSSLSLHNSTQHPVFTTEDRRVSEIETLRQLAESSAWFTNLMAWLTILITTWIVAQTMSFILAQRRKELAQLLLVGASKAQLYLLVICESVIISFLAACVGALASPVLIKPYSKLLVLSNNGSPELSYHPDFTALVISVGLIVSSTVIGALLAIRKIASLSLIEAVRSPSVVDSRKFSGKRIFMVIIGFLALGVAFLPTGNLMGYQLSTLLTATGATIVIVSLSPLLVPSISHGIGRLLSPIAPGPAQVAQEYTRLSPLRTASLATPLILLLCLVSVFAMLAQTGRSETYAQSTQLKNTDYFVSADDIKFHPQEQQDLEKNQNIAQSTSLVTAPDWLTPESNRAISIVAINPQNIKDFIPVSVREGDLSAVEGDRVASFSGRVGDQHIVQSPGGHQEVIQVVAVVDSNFFIHGDYIVDKSTFDLSNNIVDTQLLAQGSDGVDLQSFTATVHQVLPDATVSSGAEWVTQKVNQGMKSLMFAIILLAGGATVLALFNLIQTYLTALIGRRKDIDILHRVGMTRSQIMEANAIEVLMVLLVGSLLSAGAIYITSARMQVSLADMGSVVRPVLPVTIFAIMAGICLLTMLVVALVEGYWLSIRTTYRGLFLNSHRPQKGTAR